jgi:spore maturation protein CgeB
MRFLILDTYYHEPLRLVYEKHPGLELKPYTEQLEAIYNFGFGRADFLPLNLRRLGYEADQVIINAAHLQRRWAAEHGMRLPPIPLARLLARLRRAPQRLYRKFGRKNVFSTVHASNSWEAKVVAAQVEDINPDIIFNCELLQFAPEFLWQIKGQKRRLIGECAYPIPPDLDLRPYDLILCCVPNYVERFRQLGAKAELMRHAFEPSVLERLEPNQNPEGVAFMGSVGAAHQSRVALLEAVSQRVPLRCWASGGESLSKQSPLRERLEPPVWGYDMYRQIRRSQVTLNNHVDIAEDFAGNIRLFEATGVGTLLVTDWKANLHEMFEPGKEVVTYSTPEECAELVQYYLEHDDERETIARAGQERTLQDHTYALRMQELVDIVGRYF